MRDIAQLALAPDWTLAGGLAVLGDADPADVISAYQRSLIPLSDTEPLERGVDGRFGPAMTSVRTWLKPIGMKIMPTMSAEQCTDWLTAGALALADFPPRVIVKAARAAIRIPMSFLNEVDGHVRAEAEKLMDKHRTALRRLRDMHAEIRRAATPQQPLIAAPVVAEPYSVDEIRQMSPIMRKLGLGCGAISQAEIDAADFEIDAAAPEVARG